MKYCLNVPIGLKDHHWKNALLKPPDIDINDWLAIAGGAVGGDAYGAMKTK